MTTTLEQADTLDWSRRQADDSVRLTIGSPPYEDARTYGIGFKLSGQHWVDWMIPRIVEMCRITDGLVFINAAGKVRQYRYSPVVEWLVADLTRNHGIVCGPAPYVFSRVGIPGSGGPHYHRRDWEPVYAFAKPRSLPPKWSDNTAMGQPPKWAPGGAMSHRTSDGSKVGKIRAMIESDGAEPKVSKALAEGLPPGAKFHTKNNGSGMRVQCYIPPAIANPGNVIHCKVGGGQMGSKLAHENEAPFPERLVEFFVLSYCEPGGTVYDPFCGSCTTGAVAVRHGRNFIGTDVRESQIELSKRRLAEVQLTLEAI